MTELHALTLVFTLKSLARRFDVDAPWLRRLRNGQIKTIPPDLMEKIIELHAKVKGIGLI